MNRPRPEPGPAVDEALAWARHVRTARDELDPLSSAVLTLIYEHAATPAQAAALLGLDVGQVHGVLAAGLRRLASVVCPAGAAGPGSTPGLTR